MEVHYVYSKKNFNNYVTKYYYQCSSFVTENMSPTFNSCLPLSHFITFTSTYLLINLSYTIRVNRKIFFTSRTSIHPIKPYNAIIRFTAGTTLHGCRTGSKIRVKIDDRKF